MITPCGAFFKKRGDNDDPVGLGCFAKSGGVGAGDGLGELEIVVILDLAEVDAGEKFLEADDVRSLAGRFADFGERARKVRGGVRGAARLDEREFD